MADQPEGSDAAASGGVAPAARPYEEDEISLLEILVVLARHKRLVFVFPFVCAVIAAAISLLLPNIYTGTARILPPQANPSPIAAAVLGSITGLGGAGSSVGQALELSSPSDLYVGMLESRTIADDLIKRFQLQKLYETKTLVDTRKKLGGASNISAGKDGIITVKVDDEDPKRAAAMANAYVDELEKLTQNVAVTAAGQQRIFLERQLAKVKDQLADAEVALRDTQEKTGLISLSDQSKATIESVAALRAQMAAKQVQLAAMRAGMTDTNPDYVRAKQELSRLGLELARLERNDPGDTNNVIPSAGTLPQVGLEYIRKLRDVKYYQTLFDLIAKQYEIARSQEAAEGTLIQVLDPAVVPDKKSKPYRALIVLATLVIAGFLGVLAAFLMEARERAKRDPQQARQLDELRQLLPDWLSRRRA